jgi:AraC-like DNA-binding protein
VLDLRTLAEHDGLSVSDVVCHHRAGRGSDEPVDALAIVFVRRGRYLRSANGRETLLDPTLAYAMTPGQEQRCDHLDDAGDSCTMLGMTAAAAAELWGDSELPVAAWPTHGTVDLRHRLLLAAAGRGEETDEATVALAATALEQVDRARVASGRPATERARRAIADGARILLADEPRSSLVQLARALSVSPHHLSRIFSEQTASTISTHRRRIRVRAALDRLEHGEQNLARLAADVGFADHAHLTRTIRRETGTTPSRLRELLTHPRVEVAEGLEPPYRSVTRSH